MLFLGRVTWVKGLDLLLMALANVKKELPYVKLKLVGPVNQQYEAYLNRIASELQLTDSISFTGALYGQEKIDVINNSAFLVLPSYKEYTPNVLLEAQALGKPVISSNVGAVSEMLVSGETGLLIEPGNLSELVQAIKVLFTNVTLVKQASIKAVEFSKKFSSNISIEKLEKLYFAVKQ